MESMEKLQEFAMEEFQNKYDIISDKKESVRKALEDNYLWRLYMSYQGQETKLLEDIEKNGYMVTENGEVKKRNMTALELVEKTIEVVCRKKMIKKERLRECSEKGRMSRREWIPETRHIIFYLLDPKVLNTKYPDMTLHFIGKHVSGQKHDSVYYGIEKIKRLVSLPNETKLNGFIDDCKKILGKYY